MKILNTCSTLPKTQLPTLLNEFSDAFGFAELDETVVQLIGAKHGNQKRLSLVCVCDELRMRKRIGNKIAGCRVDCELVMAWLRHQQRDRVVEYRGSSVDFLIRFDP